MDGIRIAISGPISARKVTLALTIAYHSQVYTDQITIDGRMYVEGVAPAVPPRGDQIEIVTVDCEDFVDTAVGKVEGERFRDADPEVAYHIRRAPHLDDKAFDHAARRGALTFDERVIDLPIGRPGATA